MNNDTLNALLTISIDGPSVNDLDFESAVLKILNHAGIGVSSRNVWRVIKDNADITRSAAIPREAVWSYDNVNILVKVQQIRKGGRRCDLSAADLLPSKEDITRLRQRLGDHITKLLSEEFKSFSSHRKPPPVQKAVTPSTYMPLELMGENEAVTSANIVILRRFAKEANMTPENCWDQEVIGDQATCKNVRAAKRHRQDDVDNLERLSWAKECPGDFHFLWETGKCIHIAHWNSPKNVGSLAHLRDVVDRRNVDSGGKKFNAMDEFLHHACKAHLIAALLHHLGMTCPGEDVPERSAEELNDTIHSFLDKYVFKRTVRDSVDDSIFQHAVALLRHLMLYVDLRQCIRHEDGPGIISHWKFWLPTFLGTGRSQYSSEAANHLANLLADWSPRTTEVLTNNRGVNTHSREGHGKPVDMLVEHYNKILKKVLKASGGQLTLRHAQEVSLAVPLLDEARRFCDRVFQAKQTVQHTTPSSHADVEAMWKSILEGSAYSPTPGRRLCSGKEFVDVVKKGDKRITVDRWLDNFLRKGKVDDETEHNTGDEDLEVDLAALIDE
ncbi:PREDICTED: uncharacterized protein LOC109465518 [Branchiostoma belcheri]|uniref:Uncharacterized protein LOC109465518 n=1 Tax=Branchiostoma belcheri TaxID=7741 RepID=A0A6P4Y7Z0_BRABE|nr:PREDICTED: uncharacterized protein LOC109465518 [Branchiostoma belcheri]